jgi:hypothetical protein
MVRDWFPIPGQTHRRQLRNKALSECDYRAERLSNRAHPQLGKTLEYLTCERSAPYAVRPRSNISEPSNPHKFPIANFVILITKRLLSSGESLLKPAALLLLTDERAGNCATVQSGLNPYFGPLFDWNSFFRQSGAAEHVLDGILLIFLCVHPLDALMMTEGCMVHSRDDSLT